LHFFVLRGAAAKSAREANLAELLDKLAHLIRERFKLRGKIRAVSAHGRMTGMVLSLIPVVVGAIMFTSEPDVHQLLHARPDRAPHAGRRHRDATDRVTP